MKNKILLVLGTMVLVYGLILVNKAIARECYSGGTGASECTIEAGINFPGFGISKGCGTKCIDGYYACCNFHCDCRKYPSGPDTGGGNEGGGPDGGGGDPGHGV